MRMVLEKYKIRITLLGATKLPPSPQGGTKEREMGR